MPCLPRGIEMTVYLCGPIRGRTDAECYGWREIAKEAFPDATDPMRRDYRGVESLNINNIVTKDKEDIRKADIVLANCEVPSWGTAMEILYAHSVGVPVVSFCAPERLSAWVSFHSVAILGDLKSAIQFIEELG